MNRTEATATLTRLANEALKIAASNKATLGLRSVKCEEAMCLLQMAEAIKEYGPVDGLRVTYSWETMQRGYIPADIWDWCVAEDQRVGNDKSRSL